MNKEEITDFDLAIITFKENEELKAKIKELEEKIEKYEIKNMKLKKFLWNEQAEDIYLDRGIKTKTNINKSIVIQDVLNYIHKLGEE